MRLKFDIARFRALLQRHARFFLMSCASILALVAIILGIVYTSFKSIALDSVAWQYSDFAGQLDSLSDLISASVRNYGMQVFYDPLVQTLREGKNFSKLDQVYYLRNLGSYISSNDFVDSIQVYNRSTGYIYSTDSNVVSAPIGQYADQEAARLFRSLTSDMRMCPIRRTAFSESDERMREYYSFLFFETTPDDEPTGGVLMLDVDYHRYLNTLLAFEQQGCCVLLDGNGKPLTEPEEIVAQQAALFFQDIRSGEQEENGYLLKKLNGQQMVCLHFRMNIPEWYYLKIMPLEECVPRLMEFRNSLIIVILLAFLLLVVCGTSILLFLYFPVYQVQAALQKVGLSRKGELAGQVSQLAQQSREYQQANTLHTILEGRASRDGAPLTPPFILAILETDQPDRARQLLLEQCPGALRYHQNGCEVLLLSGIGTAEARPLWEELTKEPGSNCCFCGAARLTESELPACYETLCEMQKQKFWHPEQRVFPEDSFPPRKAHSSFSEAMGSNLTAALRADNLAQARLAWENIKTAVQNDSYREQLFAFRRVAAVIEGLLPSLKPLLEDSFWEQLRDIRELDTRFDTAFQSIIQNNQEQRRNRIQQLSQQVVRRIETGYADPNLSPTRIADEMGMSGAYLGRLFREDMQQSISQYISQVRIQKAEELLRTTDTSVESIAGSVGFSNVKYFYVVFKNLTGQTPLQYRKAQTERLSV